MEKEKLRRKISGQEMEKSGRKRRKNKRGGWQQTCDFEGKKYQQGCARQHEKVRNT